MQAIIYAEGTVFRVAKINNKQRTLTKDPWVENTPAQDVIHPAEFSELQGLELAQHAIAKDLIAPGIAQFFVISEGQPQPVGATVINVDFVAKTWQEPTLIVTTDSVRAEANRRILRVASVEKQLNMDRRLRELAKLETLGQDMTGYQAEITLINDKFTEIDRLRGRSNILEVALPAGYAANVHW